MDNGVTFAVNLDGQGGIDNLIALRQAESDPRPHWLHLNRSVPAMHDWLHNRAQLDEVIVDALLDTGTRPRWSEHDGGLLCTLRGVNLNPEADPEDMISIRLWLEPHRLISIHRETVRAAVAVKELLDKGRGPVTTAGLFAALTMKLTERMTQTIDDLVDQLDEIEEELDDRPVRETHQRLLRTRRVVIAIKRYLSPQREALTTLYEERPALFEDNDMHVLREATDRLARHVEKLDHTRDRATLLQEELNTRTTSELNERMYLVTVIAAVFLPLSFLTGLMGTNVGGIPGADNQLGFVIQCVLLTILGFGTYCWLRMRGWL